MLHYLVSLISTAKYDNAVLHGTIRFKNKTLPVSIRYILKFITPKFKEGFDGIRISYKMMV